MKRYLRSLVFLLFSNRFLITAAIAQNSEQVKRLLTTNECVGCELSWAELSGAELSHANLEAANLHSAHLVGANLEKANLVRANLIGANLDGANLTEAELCLATMPEGLSPCIRDVLPIPEER